MPFEKRQHPRAQIVWPVTLIGLDGLAGGVTYNLSLAGTLVYCFETPDADENVSLVLKPVESQTILATAEMVWSNALISNNNKMHAMGLCFTHFPDHGRQILSAMISNHLKLEYMKQFFTKRLNFWQLSIFNKMKLHKLKCRLCKSALLLGPSEEMCPVCENPLLNSVKF
jgi:hypothetical protein